MKKFVTVDLSIREHTTAILVLLNEYMKDEMGIQKNLPEELKDNIIKGLKNHKAYLGFLVCSKGKYIGLANCNLNYSTWKAKSILNIHDFVVHSEYRKEGVGTFLLKHIKDYAIGKGYCKLNLEVREDNFKAQELYKKEGFKSGSPAMLFWELDL